MSASCALNAVFGISQSHVTDKRAGSIVSSYREKSKEPEAKGIIGLTVHPGHLFDWEVTLKCSEQYGLSRFTIKEENGTRQQETA